MKEKLKLRFPHVFIVLIIIVVVASAMTYLIPAGSYTRVEGKLVGDSFTYIEQSGVTIWELPLKFFQSITAERTAKLIFFILIIGGSFETSSEAALFHHSVVGSQGL